MAPNNESIFTRAKNNWEGLATTEPLDSILTGFENDGDALLRFYESGEANIAQIMDRIASLGFEVNFDRALDFGCGMGRLTSALDTRFKETLGLDISETMIDIATATVSSPECKFLALEEPGLQQFESELFDFGISLLVLQHVEPKHGSMFVEELLRVLKPGGVLVLQVPHAPSFNLIGMRLKLMRSLPGFIDRPVRTLFGRPKRILMNGIRESDISKLATKYGARFLSIDRSSINGWEDRTYIMTRDAQM